MKTLYFCGMGMDFYEEASKQSDVGNFRIRTAFTNLDGKRIFLEMGNCTRYDFSKKKPEKETDYALCIDHLFEIINNDGTDDENETRIKFDWKAVRELDYSKADITAWINENLNCDFETIEVLDWSYGYRPNGNHSTYNLMENAEINHERANARRVAYKEIDKEYRKALGQKYSKISLQKMDDDSITVKCYASDQALNKTNLPRVQRIEVTCKG